MTAGSLADEARSTVPATSRPPCCSISAHGLSSWPGDALRGTSGPCATAILRLGTACRGGAHGGEVPGNPPATGAAGPPPPSGPFMARPPASPSSRVRGAAITTGERRFTACCCESWEEGLLLDVARLSGPRRARSPGSSSSRCCGRAGRGVVSGLRRRPRRARTHRRLTHGHRHHSRTRARDSPLGRSAQTHHARTTTATASFRRSSSTECHRFTNNLER